MSKIGALYALELAQTGDEILEVLNYIVEEVTD
jgi:hypothetical protein